MDASTGDAIKTWRFSNMKQWDVNWEIKTVTVEFADEVCLSFICTEVDCKVVHEFIGGYIFLSTPVQKTKMRVLMKRCSTNLPVVGCEQKCCVMKVHGHNSYLTLKAVCYMLLNKVSLKFKK